MSRFSSFRSDKCINAIYFLFFFLSFIGTPIITLHLSIVWWCVTYIEFTLGHIFGDFGLHI